MLGKIDWVRVYDERTKDKVIYTDSSWNKADVEISKYLEWNVCDIFSHVLTKQEHKRSDNQEYSNVWHAPDLTKQ